MPFRSIRHFARTVLFGLTVVSVSYAASADVAGAEQFVESEHGKIKKLVENNAPKDDITHAIDGMVDYDAISQAALGKPCPTSIPDCTNHWDQLTPEQQTEVRDLFKQLVEKKYRENAYKTKNFDVTYKGGKDVGNNVAKVKTEASDKQKPREPPVRVDYIIRGAGPYKVIDLVTEGSILSKNYYDQSHKMLTTAGQGYPYFVNKLKEKIAKPGNTGNTLH